jgi:CubicO group peptidase (beta-lactamase class C family)
MMRITSLVTVWLLIRFSVTEMDSTSYAQEAAPLPVALAEPSLQKAIDDYVGSEMGKQRIPGLSLAVVRAGKLVQAKGYGKASLELDVPATAATLYGLGSISKQFTATAIMLLVEAGKIALDERLANHFGWLPKEWADVTVRHLLTHTSGIPEQQWKGGILEFDRFEQDQREVVKTAFGLPMLAKPGEKFAYSNVGYRLLGMLIEKVSGQSYWDYLSEHIFRPIGMEATRNSDPKTVILNRARGYGISGSQHENREPVTASSAFAQGALISSVLDMVKWDAALNSEGLLRRATLDQMWTPARLNDGTTYPYGFGWYLRPIPGHRTVAHGGGLPGFATFIWRFIDDQLTVIVLANCETADTIRIALGVAGLHVPALLSPEIKKQL